jgi:ubiquinone biosynthesis protein
LVYSFLQQKNGKDQQLVQELLREQRRTNRLLQGLVYGGLGFVLGMLAIQILTRIRIF